ncbi:type I inositol polyphosphate 5-phosphatase 10-like isoform X2 [Amaranthus tricolor]|uniref:type I inositol polyphosphate 5-phosphatase 10-like isoform X2 n=1 Tax=Amaranthus tricolor TaxID=29722 RepID=UPI002589ED67|nr:type I inositol polyphosphate 5-phosphatase 10-like isoform X2 [Amaranthus tricolor]
MAVYGIWRFWTRAIQQILDGFKMALRIQDRKSKFLIHKMFSAKDRCRRGTKYPSEGGLFTGACTEVQTAGNAKSLKTFVATWNVGGKFPETGLVLDDFLQVNAPSDIYILGFQEIVPLNAGNVLVIEDSEPAARWLALINQSLNRGTDHFQMLSKTTSLIDSKTFGGSKQAKLTSTSSGLLFFPKYSLKTVSKQFRTERKKRLKYCNCASDLDRRYTRDSCFPCQQSNVSDDDLSSEEDDGPNGVVFSEIMNSSGNDQKYSLIVSKQMVGIFLTIWVKRELVQHISHLKTSCISRGIMGLGNKGCIAVSMLLYRTSLCFICSHLASGEKEGDELRRNLDVIEILKCTYFPRRCKIPNSQIPETILEHDRIVWLGDLNYRISLSHTETLKLLNKKDWDCLLSKDQLKIEREAGRVFKGWREGPIKFAPTYKYSYNSDTYLGEANISSSKKRTPAWCDRILWKGEGIHQLSYERKDSSKYQFSDHRPVYATFNVEVAVREPSNLNFCPIEVE